MPIVVKKTTEMVMVQIRTEKADCLNETKYECTVDFDQTGDILGFEVEAPCQTFGPVALEGLELIELNEANVPRVKTPEGRTLAPLAQGRPPLRDKKGSWLGYDRKHDMLYVCIAPELSNARTYEISIPVDCRFFLDARGRIHKIELPLTHPYDTEK